MRLKFPITSLLALFVMGYIAFKAIRQRRQHRDEGVDLSRWEGEGGPSAPSR